MYSFKCSNVNVIILVNDVQKVINSFVVLMTDTWHVKRCIIITKIIVP